MSGRWYHTPSRLHVRVNALTAAGEAADRVVATHARTNLALTQHNVSRMRPGEWLDDECINMYLALLQVKNTYICCVVRCDVRV